MSFIYLASPYSDPDPMVRNQNFQNAKKAAAYLLRRTSSVVYSPVVYGVVLEQEATLGRQTHAFWMRQARAMLACCTEVCVLVVPGTGKSVGVAEEIALAQRLNKNVTYCGLRTDRHGRAVLLRLKGLETEQPPVYLDPRTLALLDQPESLQWD